MSAKAMQWNHFKINVTVQPVIASEAKQSRGIASVATLPRNDDGVAERLQINKLLIGTACLLWFVSNAWAERESRGPADQPMTEGMLAVEIVESKGLGSLLEGNERDPASCAALLQSLNIGPSDWRLNSEVRDPERLASILGSAMNLKEESAKQAGGYVSLLADQGIVIPTDTPLTGDLFSTIMDESGTRLLDPAMNEAQPLTPVALDVFLEPDSSSAVLFQLLETGAQTVQSEEQSSQSADGTAAEGGGASDRVEDNSAIEFYQDSADVKEQMKEAPADQSEAGAVESAEGVAAVEDLVTDAGTEESSEPAKEESSEVLAEAETTPLSEVAEDLGQISEEMNETFEIQFELPITELKTEQAQSPS